MQQKKYKLSHRDLAAGYEVFKSGSDGPANDRGGGHLYPNMVFDENRVGEERTIAPIFKRSIGSTNEC